MYNQPFMDEGRATKPAFEMKAGFWILFVILFIVFFPLAIIQLIIGLYINHWSDNAKKWRSEENVRRVEYEENLLARRRRERSDMQ